ncbi:MAG: NusG domain II-containing protein [Clostridium sp.]
MSKKDIKLILVILIASVVIFLGYKILKPKGDLVEIVHLKQVIKTIDVSKNERYEIQGTYGSLIVETKDNKVRITEEECPNHLCSSIGWIDKESYMPIVCLPNYIAVSFKVIENE